MSEANLWSRLKKGMESIAHTQPAGICMDRIENALVPGMPDANLSSAGVDVWLELKHIGEKPKRADTKVFGNKGLRPEQIPWCMDRAKCGSRVFIFAQIEEGLVLMHGIYAKQFNDMPITEIGLRARWKHYGNKPDWQELFRMLFIVPY
jgi:hypothetical protein